MSILLVHSLIKWLTLNIANISSYFNTILSYYFIEDVLKDDKGECVICLEELTQGDTIARLPCLCIYHKT